MDRAVLKRLAGIVGTLLCLVAAGLLIHRGVALGSALGDRLAEISPLAFLAALVLYVVGALALGGAWVLLVHATSGSPLRARPLFVAHLRAQLAKYLPGNVFHLAWRHVAARRQSVGHGALGAALALESVFLIAAAAVLAAGIASDPRLARLAPWAHHLVWLAPLTAAIGAAAGVVFAAKRLDATAASPARVARSLVMVFVIDVGFFLLAATALRLLCTNADTLSFAAWVGWLSIAWAIGYVTPGAPAGLGLREAVLAIGLGPILGEAGAVALALAYRLLTLLADAILAAAGFAMLRGRSGSEEAP